MTLPPLQHALRVLDHQLYEAVDELAVEGGLGQAPLAAPEVPLAADEPLAHDHAPLVVDEGRLGVVLVVVLQHVLHVVRMDHQVHGEERAHAAEADDVAVLAPPLEQRPDQVELETARVPQYGMAPWPRGETALSGISWLRH